MPATGGFKAVTIKVKLPDGRIYKAPRASSNFVDNTVQTSTDTIILRGTIPNPILLAMASEQQPRFANCPTTNS